MNGTIAKQNKDGTVKLISTATEWMLEQNGKIVDRTKDPETKDKWINDYKLTRNVGQFWYKEEITSGRIVDDLKDIYITHLKDGKLNDNELSVLNRAIISLGTIRSSFNKPEEKTEIKSGTDKNAEVLDKFFK